MNLKLAYEAAHFLDREDLDSCQLTARCLSAMIRGATTLPLRSARAAGLVDGSAYIVLQRTQGHRECTFEAPMTSANFDFILRHLNNAAVDCFTIGCTQNIVHFVRRLSSSSVSMSCRLLYVPEVGESVNVEGDVISATIDALHPQKYDVDLSSLGADEAAQQVLLPTSLRASVEIVSIRVDSYVPVRAWELIRNAGEIQAIDVVCSEPALFRLVDRFIEEFEENAAFAVGSLSVHSEVGGPEQLPSKLRHRTPSPDAVPRDDFLRERYGFGFKNSACVRYRFAMDREALDVYTWTVTTGALNEDRVFVFTRNYL